MSDKQIDYKDITYMIEQSIENSAIAEKNTHDVLTEIKDKLPELQKNSEFDFNSIKTLIDNSYIKTFGNINADDEIYNKLIEDIKNLFENAPKKEQSTEILSDNKEEIPNNDDNEEEILNDVLDIFNNFLNNLDNLINSKDLDLDSDDGISKFTELYTDFLSDLSDNGVEIFNDDGLLSDKFFKYLNETELEKELTISDLSKPTNKKKKKNKKEFGDYFKISSDRRADSISGSFGRTIGSSINSVINVIETVKDSFKVVMHPIDTFKRVKDEGIGSLFKSTKKNEELLKVGIGKNTLNTDTVLKNSTYGVAIKWLYELLQKKKANDEKIKEAEEKAKEIEQSGSDIANGLADSSTGLSGGLMGGFDMKTIGIIVAAVAAIALGGWLLKKFFDNSKDEKENNKPKNKPEKDIDNNKSKPSNNNTPKPQKLTQPTSVEKNEEQPNNKEVKEKDKPKAPTDSGNVKNKFGETDKAIDKETKEYSRGIKDDKKKEKQKPKSNIIESDKKEDLEEDRKRLKKEEEIAEAMEHQSKNTVPLKDLAEPSLWDKFTSWLKGIGEGITNGTKGIIDKVKTWFNNVKDYTSGIFNNLLGKTVKFAGGNVGKITSGYGMRNNPLGGGKTEFHPGIDTAAPMGTPVYAIADGIIKRSGSFGKGSGWSGYGNTVSIQLDNGDTISASHLLRTAIKAGEKVKKGQLIGYVGSTGRSTGAHIHWEGRKKDKYGQTFDPSPYLNDDNDISSTQKPKEKNIETPKPSKPKKIEQRPITKEVANKNKRETEKDNKAKESYHLELAKNIGVKYNEQKSKDKKVSNNIIVQNQKLLRDAINDGDNFMLKNINMHFSTGR